MGSNDLQRPPAAGSAFADTVQSEPPAAAREPAAGESLPAPDSDLGLEFASEGDAAVAERPTLSHIGRYALKTLLGEGGLGRVYEAWDPLLSRTVAVKTLQFDLDAPSRLALDRQLLNEARAAANLSHAHIVTVHDAGLSAHGVYIAMERLRGRDLRQMLASGWRPTPERAAQIVRRVADALAYAHARGVVHCDIKPGNIFLTRKERPKVLDFGIARIANATTRPQSEAVVAGSPHYLAPEQLDGGTVDARTDLYALGVVLYELLAGRKAFPGDSLEQIHAAVRAGGVPPLHEVQPAVPRALSDIVGRAMDAVPERRFANAAELSRALRQWAAALTPDDAAATPEAAVPGAARHRRARSAAALAAGGLLAVAAAIAAWSWPGEASGPMAGAGPDGVVAPAAAAPALPPAVATATATVAGAGPGIAASAGGTVAEPAGRAPIARPTAAPADPGPVATVARSSPRPSAARARPAPTDANAEAAAAAPSGVGTLQIAVSPWGEIEVDGRPAGTTPPLTQLNLAAGAHTVTIRNADFPPFNATVQVQADRSVSVRHRFGS